MKTIIRKISVGKDYPNGSIHYQIGTRQNLKGKRYIVTDITIDTEILEKVGDMAFNIYVENVPMTKEEPVNKVLWKTIIGVPVVVENNIDFE